MKYFVPSRLIRKISADRGAKNQQTVIGTARLLDGESS